MKTFLGTGKDCSQDEDCAADQICEDGVCINHCRDVCEENYICVVQKRIPLCHRPSSKIHSKFLVQTLRCWKVEYVWLSSNLEEFPVLRWRIESLCVITLQNELCDAEWKRSSPESADVHVRVTITWKWSGIYY